MFTLKTRLRLYHTDAAQLPFFGSMFMLVHDAEDAFLRHIGISIEYLMYEADYIFPVVHTESDYLKPILAGEELEIHMAVDHIGKTSVSFVFDMVNVKGEKVFAGKVVHVTTNKKTRQKIDIPTEFLAKLKEYQKNPS